MALQTPTPTLFITNIENKIKKPELRQQLYALFTPYGRVIDVVAQKHNGGRGKAFVVFEEQAAATAALRALTGELFYKRPLTITYARTTSHATIARLDPTQSRDAQAIKAAKMVVSHAQGEYEQLEREREAEEAGIHKRSLDGEEGSGEAGQPETKRLKKNENAQDEEEEEEEMEIEMEEDDDGNSAPKPTGPSVICTNLPAECNVEIMGALFSQHAGFGTASSVPSTTPIPSSHPEPNPGAKSFRISFDSTAHAEAAVTALQGFLMQPGWEMALSLEKEN